MKRRLAFVANSSATSFLVQTDFLTAEQKTIVQRPFNLNRALMDYLADHNDPHQDEDSDYVWYSSILEDGWEMEDQMVGGRHFIVWMCREGNDLAIRQALDLLGFPEDCHS
jgi:hypothetical protein